MNALKVFTILSTIIAFCGCSRFESAWRQELTRPVPTNDITGPWEGRWASEVNGHTDKLRAIVTKTGQENYDVRFHAAYKKGITFHFGYTVHMRAAPGNDAVAFQGTEDLGIFAGGVYTYAGHATPTNFFSTYDSKYDRGTFQMNRPAGTIPVYSAPGGR